MQIILFTVLNLEINYSFYNTKSGDIYCDASLATHNLDYRLGFQFLTYIDASLATHNLDYRLGFQFLPYIWFLQ